MIYKIKENESLLRLIVKAVEKGTGEDIREYLMSTDKATNNAIRLMRADNINTNLRDSVAGDTIELKYFNRSAWTGCLLIDRQHKITYTICSKQTLEGIPKKKDRKIPHYLQSILHIQNAEVEAEYQQMSFAECGSEVGTIFEDEEYRKDYKGVMGEDISFDDNYIHMVVVYEAQRLSITSIAVKLLTPDFQTSQAFSLDHLLKPDFSNLTIQEKSEQTKKDSHALISVKTGLKKPGEVIVKQETIVTPKKMEGKKQA